MGLKGTLSDRLADFFFKLTLEVMSRALSVDRKERGSVLSTLEIEPRTPTRRRWPVLCRTNQTQTQIQTNYSRSPIPFERLHTVEYKLLPPLALRIDFRTRCC
jgi:hypothetical protein